MDEFTGRFVATEDVQVRARVGGYVTDVHFRDGQLVEPGDLLYTLDQRMYRANLQAAEALVAEAVVGLDLARIELDRAAQLRRTQAVAAAVYDQREGAVRRGEAQALAAEAALARARLDLEFTEVRAPIRGRVDRHYVSPGNVVSGGSSDATLLTTLLAVDPIHFVFDMDQGAHLRNTRQAIAGTRASSQDAPTPIRLQLADEQGAFPHQGAMHSLANQVDGATGSLRGRAVFSNPDGLFLPGVFARAQISASGPYEAVLVPDSAVGTEGAGRFLYVVNDDDVPEAKPVQLGRLVDGLRVIRSGVAPQDRIVIGGLQRVRGGQKVSPREEAIDTSRGLALSAPSPGWNVAAETSASGQERQP